MLVRPVAIPAPTISVAVTTTASSSALLPGQGNTLRITNEGPNACFIALTTPPTAAVATVPGGAANLTSNAVPVGDSSFTIPSSGVMNFSVICRATQSAAISLSVTEGQ